ncbi:hypothetical protein [Tepidiphilus margaritifer]|uniref:hypothetical protein n=1 Tax=Tepidiphilus margaritifer TaxID=203471 RepID=UPI0012FA6006|nr:hypothetical protein [Tepidiphilus margaritifer]
MTGKKKSKYSHLRNKSHSQLSGQQTGKYGQIILWAETVLPQPAKLERKSSFGQIIGQINTGKIFFERKRYCHNPPNWNGKVRLGNSGQMERESGRRFPRLPLNPTSIGIYGLIVGQMERRIGTA